MAQIVAEIASYRIWRTHRREPGVFILGISEVVESNIQTSVAMRSQISIAESIWRMQMTARQCLSDEKRSYPAPSAGWLGLPILLAIDGPC